MNDETKWRRCSRRLAAGAGRPCPDGCCHGRRRQRGRTVPAPVNLLHIHQLTTLYNMMIILYYIHNDYLYDSHPLQQRLIQTGRPVRLDPLIPATLVERPLQAETHETVLIQKRCVLFIGRFVYHMGVHAGTCSRCCSAPPPASRPGSRG